MVNTHRYWDGGKWTNHRQAMIAVQEPEISTAPGFWAAFLFPLLGLILGITYMGKKPGDGITVITLSVVVAMGYWLVLSALLTPGGY